MKLLGRDIPIRPLIDRIEDRLKGRGLSVERSGPITFAGVEPRVDPLSFNLTALEEHADPTRALPLETHRGGLGRAVLAAKWAFRKSCQVLINETLGRQRIFNGHVVDAYAQLSAELLRLRREVDALQPKPAARGKRRSAPPPPEGRMPEGPRSPGRKGG